MSDQQKLPPAWVVKALESFREFLRRIIRHTMPGNVVVYEQFQQIWIISAMHAAADLDIAGLLKEGAMTSAAIASYTGAHEE
ncbi:MAG: hydroxyneurosporene methyltransferase, partial [Bacteroidetes bacterium]|nr:hydroxyneurosporene methyltransferase [Bacteroidota bacterium]